MKKVLKHWDALIVMLFTLATAIFATCIQTLLMKEKVDFWFCLTISESIILAATAIIMFVFKKKVEEYVISTELQKIINETEELKKLIKD